MRTVYLGWYYAGLLIAAVFLTSWVIILLELLALAGLINLGVPLQIQKYSNCPDLRNTKSETEGLIYKSPLPLPKI